MNYDVAYEIRKNTLEDANKRNTIQHSTIRIWKCGDNVWNRFLEKLPVQGASWLSVQVPHNITQFDLLIDQHAFSMGRGLNIHLTKNIGVSSRIVEKVLAVCPYANIFCSEYSFRKRASVVYKGLLNILVLGAGNLRRWTGEMYQLVRRWAYWDGKPLPEICRGLQAFGIYISVKGLMLFRWKHTTL